MHPVSALFSDDASALERVYSPECRSRLERETRLLPGTWNSARLRQGERPLAEVEALFCTWGMPLLSPRDLEALPRLRAVFHAAGSVQSFARPLLERGVAVYCAALDNARPTAEFSLACILLSAKRGLAAMRALREGGASAWALPEGPLGGAGTEIALLGAGRVGRTLLALLRPFGFRVLVYDPLLGEAEAKELGVERVSLAEAFARGQVVSNHLPDLPATRGLLTEALLRSLPPHAVFLNTGRGATVDEAGLWAALKARPDLGAVLDVLQKEPPDPSSPAFSLNNVFLTPHLAGSLGREQERLGLAMLEALDDWKAGRPNPRRVELAMLESMA